MPKHISHHKKSFGRRLSAWLGIRHTSKTYYLIYFLAIIALIILFPMIMKFFTGFKENYGKGYGYVPRDFERSERLIKEKKPIPFQPNEALQYDKSFKEKK